MEVWQAITYVSSPLTLVAFLAAIVAWVYVTQIKRVENLIDKSKASDRKILLEGVLDVMKVNTENLPPTKRYDIALRLLQARALKLKLAFAAFLIVALALLALSVFAIYRQPAEKSISDLLESDQKSEAIAALKKHQIYLISDSDLPSALSNLVKLDNKEISLGVMERTDRLREKIETYPSIKELRRRAEKMEAPFERLGLKLKAGVPKIGPDQPSRFYVNVPISADYAWKRIRLLNPQTGTELRLIARPAIDDQIRDVDLHLNYLQAEQILGSQLPSRTVELWVQVLGPGQLFDPSCEPARKQADRKKPPACDSNEAPDYSAMLNSRG